MQLQHHFRSIIQAIAISVALAPAISFGGGTGVLLLGDESSQIAWQDNGNIRIDESDDESLIVRDKTPYVITEEDGRLLVIDMTGMAEFLAEFGGELKDSPYDWGKMDTFREMKSREVVAGIEGNVYAITLKNPNGQTESFEAVLTNDSQAVELMQRYAETLNAMFGISEVADLLDELPKDQRGVLRFGRYLHLTSLSSDEPADDLFELPGKPVSFGDLISGSDD